jgi:hypothetical protein
MEGLLPEHSAAFFFRCRWSSLWRFGGPDGLHDELNDAHGNTVRSSNQPKAKSLKANGSCQQLVVEQHLGGDVFKWIVELGLD